MRARASMTSGVSPMANAEAAAAVGSKGYSR